MKNIKNFNKLYILSNGSSFWKNSCAILVLNSNIFFSVIRVDCFQHPFWNFGVSLKTTNVLPIYSKIFKL